MLQQLLNRTLPNQTWNVARQYVEQRFTGENLERARTFLNDKQMEHMPTPEHDYEAMQQRRASGQAERAERVMPPLDDLVPPPGGLDSQAETSFFKVLALSTPWGEILRGFSIPSTEWSSCEIH